MLEKSLGASNVSEDKYEDVGDEYNLAVVPLSFNHRLVQFIGVDTYIEAGGSITKSPEQSVCDNPVLVRTLAMKKLQEKALHLQSQGWGWVKCEIDFPYQLANQYSRISARTFPSTEVYDTEIDKLENEIFQLEQSADLAGGDSAMVTQRFEALASRQNQLFAERQEYIVLNAEWDPLEKAGSGCILAVSQLEGALEIQAGFVEKAASLA